MSRVTEIQALIASLQAELALLNSAPPDTYNFNTIALFSASAADNNAKILYRKIGEETWVDVKNGGEKALSEWIVLARSAFTYFEVFILTVPLQPLYASA